MNRRAFTKTATLSTLMGMVSTGSMVAKEERPQSVGRPKKRPNVLFIFPDQLRLQSLGIWREREYQSAIGTIGDPVVTPTLNQLARESVLFNQASSTFPLCSPYRGMLLSGMYPANNGVENNCRRDRKDSLRHDVDCLTDVLSHAGYETAYVGKTHWEENESLFDEEGNYVGLKKAPGGHPMNEYDTYIPEGRGRHSLKYWFQCVKDDHKDPRVYSSDAALIGGKRDGEQYRPRIYSPKLEADVIEGYLKNTRSQRKADQPFCLIWAPNPPHNPYESEEDCDEEAYRDFYQSKKPNDLLIRPNAVGMGSEKGKKACPYYFANVTGIDKQVKRVLDCLEAIGEAENTVVVFTSDHGEMMGSHGRMGKGVIYDESFLVPLMIRYPDQLKPRVEDLMVTPVDLMPTLLGLVGLEKTIPYTVEGINYANGLRSGDFEQTPKPKAVPIMGHVMRGLRTEQYSLGVHEDGTTLLFDNLADPYQLKNLPLSHLNSTVRTELFTLLGEFLKQMNDPWFKKRIQEMLIPYPT